MNVFLLKSIALITMITDHYGAIFHPNIILYRIIGRLAFPIYAFLLVEGYTHTRNIKKYGIRLLLFAFISEIPFDFAFYNEINFNHQNIFFTLTIGLAIMYFLDNKDRYSLSTPLVIGIGLILSMIMAVDYNYIGIIYILSFYYMKNLKPGEKLLKAGGIIFLTNIISTTSLQQFSLLSLPILYLYNGKLGPKNRFLQFIFYLSYPLHLIIFYLI